MLGNVSFVKLISISAINTRQCCLSICNLVYFKSAYNFPQQSGNNETYTIILSYQQEYSKFISYWDGAFCLVSH